MLTAVTVAGSLLLFSGRPLGEFTLRSLEAAWNFGHVLLFFLWTRILQGPLHRRFAQRPLVVLPGVLAGMVVAGLVVEGIQGWMGRSADLGDVARNLVGGWLAAAWADPGVRQWPTPFRRLARATAAGLLAVAVWPLLSSALDEWAARGQFPLLSSLESPFEKSRWTGDARSVVSTEQSSDGRNALKVYLTTDRFSGAFLSFFPGDWRGFDLLTIDIYNPGAGPISLTCRIHDALHENRYADRFNRRYRLAGGWNRIAVDLKAVRDAPADRQMDLTRIRAVGLFSSALPAPRVIYIDNVRLATAPP